MIRTLQPPESLAIPLGEVKAYLKIAHSAEDGLLTTLIRTAESFLGEKKGHYGLTRTLSVGAPILHDWSHSRTRWPALEPAGSFVMLPLYPIQSIDVVTVIQRNGRRKELSPPNILWTPDQNTSWPPKIFLNVWDGVEAHLHLTVGYGGEGSSIPSTLRYQILSEVVRFYERRGSLDQTSLSFPHRFSL